MHPCYLRPYMLQPYNCKNILISGVKMINSPMWFISPVRCENVIVEKVHIQAVGPNTDGCDPDACKNVLIKDCYFDTGDDCIAIKSGRDEDGREYMCRKYGCFRGWRQCRFCKCL